MTAAGLDPTAKLRIAATGGLRTAYVAHYDAAGPGARPAAKRRGDRSNAYGISGKAHG